MPKVFFTMMIIEFPGMFSLVVCYSLNFELKAVKREVKDGMYSPATYWLVFTLIQIPMIFRNRRPFRTHLAPLLPRHGVVERPEILCALRHERRHILVLPPPPPVRAIVWHSALPLQYLPLSSLIFPYLPLSSLIWHLLPLSGTVLSLCNIFPALYPMIETQWQGFAQMWLAFAAQLFAVRRDAWRTVQFP